MDITFDPRARQISPMRTARSAAPQQRETQTAGQSQDTMEISHEGQQAAAGAPDLDQSWEKLEAALRSMSRDGSVSTLREQLDEQELEINWNATVDPDGQIWCKSYFDSFVSQVTEFRDTAERAIKEHYVDAYQEALNSPLGQDLPSQLNFIAAKYQCSWTDYFDASMPAGERQWTYTQVRAMLTGSGLHLNDPYALKGIHIPTDEETSKNARQAADDTISALVRQAKADAG